MKSQRKKTPASKNLVVPLVPKKRRKPLCTGTTTEHEQDAIEYVVSALIRCKGKPGRRQFLVSWAGWDSEHNTWEDEATLRQDVPLKVKAFLRKSGIQAVKHYRNIRMTCN